MDNWISVSEELPEINQAVALMNINQWENTGGGHDRNIQDCGYLSDFGGKYWSIRGEMGMVLNAYTHWIDLPPPPEGVKE